MDIYNIAQSYRRSETEKSQLLNAITTALNLQGEVIPGFEEYGLYPQIGLYDGYTVKNNHVYLKVRLHTHPSFSHIATKEVSIAQNGQIIDVTN